MYVNVPQVNLKLEFTTIWFNHVKPRNEVRIAIPQNNLQLAILSLI